MKKTHNLSSREITLSFPVKVSVKETQQGRIVQPHNPHPRQEQLNLSHLSQELLTILFLSGHTFFLTNLNLSLSVKRGWMILFLLGRLPAVSLNVLFLLDVYQSQMPFPGIRAPCWISTAVGVHY